MNVCINIVITYPFRDMYKLYINYICKNTLILLRPTNNKVASVMNPQVVPRTPTWVGVPSTSILSMYIRRHKTIIFKSFIRVFKGKSTPYTLQNTDVKVINAYCVQTCSIDISIKCICYIQCTYVNFLTFGQDCSPSNISFGK